MKSQRPPLLESLSQELELATARFPRDSIGVVVSLPQPDRLNVQTARIAQRFEQGAPQPPMVEQRQAALARLRRGETSLSPQEWGHVAWGLCDDDHVHPRGIEDPALFGAMLSHTDTWIASRNVRRKPWLGLLNSYFSYHPDQEAGHANWLRLQERLRDTMPLLIASQKRPKLWSRLLEQHRDLLTDDAGRTLHQVLFHGTASEFEEINRGLPVPDSSWVWQRAIARQIAYLNDLPEEAFIQVIPAMLKFLEGHPLYADELLAALLTHYCQFGRRDEPHELLKNVSFARWGNPQLVEGTRWRTMVDEPVHAMVLRWFAKQDLEHFFKILQGAGQVDKERLEYWSRFVDQMSYTRILLGPDALNSMHSEFRNFRTMNAGRYGRLTGGPGHNNAFIMRINDQLFVEFSGTGNACYVYGEKHARPPFDPQAASLHTNLDLKRIQPDPYRRQSDNRILHSGSWQYKANLFLADRGIRPGAGAGTVAQRPLENYRPRFAPHKPAAPVTARQAPPAHSTLGTSASSSSLADQVHRAIRQASELARINGARVQNDLDQGDCFWVLAPNPGPVLKRELIRLGLNFQAGKGFWIK